MARETSKLGQYQDGYFFVVRLSGLKDVNDIVVTIRAQPYLPTI